MPKINTDLITTPKLDPQFRFEIISLGSHFCWGTEFENENTVRPRSPGKNHAWFRFPPRQEGDPANEFREVRKNFLIPDRGGRSDKEVALLKAWRHWAKNGYQSEAIVVEMEDANYNHTVSTIV